MREFWEWLTSLLFPAKYPEFPAECRGWGWVNQWATAPEDYIDALADAGCNTAHIELLLWGKLGLYDEDNAKGRDWIWTQLGKLLKRAKRKGVFVSVNMTNYNVGNTKYPENGTIPLSRYDDAWFRRLLAETIEIINLSGMHDHAAIGACSEWTGAKYENWNRILDSMWDGWKLWNWNSRPIDLPQWAGDKWIVEYHPVKTYELGPPGCYVVGDTGAFITAFGQFRGHVTNLTGLCDYAETCSAKGNGFMFYCFHDGGQGIDYRACETIGAGKGGVK